MSDVRKDGGAAFPTTPENSPDPAGSRSRGMSLRDYFAAKALTGLCACPSIKLPTMADYARHAYKMADAMLAERSKS